mgnify:CR=1 FL=1
MRERAEAMVLASFAADSHALGAHWIYDTNEIASRYGRVERLLPAPPDSLHAGRPMGAFTHYGDQTLLLLRHLAARKSLDITSFSEEWRAYMQGYDGYVDHATNETLSNLAAGRAPAEAGSSSHDLGGAARIAPLAYRYRDERDALVETAREQTAMTHREPLVVDAAGVLGHILWIVLNGKTPSAATRTVIDARPDAEISALLRRGLESTGETTAEAARRLGQDGSVAAALPLAINLIMTYEGSLASALVENVAAGGDSAARGMVVGMVLGAFHGRDAIPDDWIEGMRAYREISTLLEDLEAVLQRTGTTGGRSNSGSAIAY